MLGGSDQSIDEEYTEDTRNNGNEDVTREAHLMLPSPWLALKMDYQAYQGSYTGTPPFAATMQDAQVRIFDSFLANERKVRYYDGKYWPNFFVQIDYLSLGDDELGLYAYMAWISTLNLQAGTAFTGTLTMSDATEYDIPMFCDSGSSIPAPSFALSCDNDYWPHKKTDGSPKYNSTTGAKL